MKSVTRVNRPSQNADVGEKIKYIRTEMLMSQNELADSIGRKRPEITMYETGARTPDIYTLRDIANALEVSTDYLLGINDIETSEITNIDIHKLTGLSKGAIKNLVYLNKYHKGYLLPTINYLLEQEQLFPKEYYCRVSESGTNISDKQLAKAFEEFKGNDNKRIITHIDNYFKVKIENEEEFFITIPSLINKKDITDLYDCASVKSIVASKELADMVLLKEIEKQLERAKAEYLSDDERNESK